MKKILLAKVLLGFATIWFIAGIFITISMIPKDVVIGSILTVVFVFACTVLGKTYLKLREKQFEKERFESTQESKKVA